MIVSCAWCGRLSSDRETWHRPPASLVSFLNEAMRVSHGICPVCFAKHVREFARTPRP